MAYPDKFKAAVLVEDGFEEADLTIPKDALEEAGINALIISPQKEFVKGRKDENWSIEFPVDINIGNVQWDTYEILIIPGGVISCDKMRRNVQCIDFVKEFLISKRLMIAIGHAPQLLIETSLLRGRRMTSSYSIRTDLLNAGVIWEEDETVNDKGLVTGRTSEGILLFMKAVIEEIREKTSLP